jgi:membrane protein implicated in regulation of membrane protease activity
MNPIAVTAVQAMVAPVVLITTAAILSGALLTMYGSVNDRMRAMDRERLDILTGAAGTLLSAAEVPPAGRERLTQIDAQLPMLLRRHRLLHNAVLLIYAGVAVLVLSVIAIGVAVTGSSGAAGTAALALVLAGTVMLLGGLLFAARSIMISMRGQPKRDHRRLRSVTLNYPSQRRIAESARLVGVPSDRVGHLHIVRFWTRLPAVGPDTLPCRLLEAR